MNIAEIKERFYALPVWCQCKLWNKYADRIEEKDGDDLHVFSNKDLDRYESLNELAYRYHLEPCDMFIIGAVNSDCIGLIGWNYMFYDPENVDIHVVRSFEEFVEADTLNDFFETLKRWDKHNNVDWNESE